MNSWHVAVARPDDEDLLPQTDVAANRELVHLRARIDELRSSIDRLRYENQQLRFDLQRHSEIRFLARCGILASTRWLRRQTTLTCQRLTKSGQSETDSYSRDFSPYQVAASPVIASDGPRVIHAIANLETGGSARLVVDLIEHLSHRYQQTVLTKALPQQPGYQGLNPVVRRHFRSPYDVLAQLRRLEPDLVHVHFLANPRSPFDISEWTWYARLIEGASRFGCRIVQNINIPTDPYINEAVDAYVFVSESVRRAFGLAAGPNLTIYPGSDFGFFSHSDNAASRGPCIGMVYRLEGDKLDQRSIDVFIDVVCRCPETRALIVGGGSLLNGYRDAVRRAGVSDRFEFTGYVSYRDLPRYYERLRVFVAPVHTESFGQVTPFAMHMGIPVVGYRVGALEEIIGEPALLAPPGDSERLAQIIIELLNDPQRCARIGDRNRARARTLFSLESMIRRYESLYERLLDPTHVGAASSPLARGTQQ